MKRPGKAPKIHLICNAHLDPVWLWDWEEGLTEALSTFEVAADLLEENPDFIFNHNESLLYEWALEYRPALFKRIRRLVKAGRWHIAGGWYLQPDCNFPDGESFVRQILTGRLFFQKHFTARPAIAYNFDAFGHHGNLPQMLCKSGYRAYVHFRPDPRSLALPGDLYRWRGIDQSEVLAYRPPFAWYGTDHFHELNSRIDETVEKLAKAPHPVGIFWGMGDHGGGATRDDLKKIAERQRLLPGLKHSSMEELLRELQTAGAGAPVHRGELQKAFVGCYTSVAAIKQANRRAESLVKQAERFATLAWWFCRIPYPAEKIAAVWKDALFNQFHDILPGSCTRKALQGAFEIAGRQNKNAREIILQSQLHLGSALKKRPFLSLLVFNPLSHAARAPVDFEYSVGHRPIFDRSVITRITSASGKNVPCQEETAAAWTTRYDWRKRAVFEAELPALGYGVFQIHLPTKPKTAPKAGVFRTERGGCICFSNPDVSLAIHRRTGLVQSLLDRQTNHELLKKPGGRLIVCRDESDSWGTEAAGYADIVGGFHLAKRNEVPVITGHLNKKPASPVRIIEQGPVRTVVEVVQTFDKSLALVRYTIYARRPEIEIELRIVWNQARRLLKYCWPTVFDEETYCVEIPYGDVLRSKNSGEQPNGRWVLLTAKPPVRQGIGFVSMSAGGHDVQNGELRFSLLRSAIYAHAFTFPWRPAAAPDLMDLGELRFKFAILPSGKLPLRPALLRLTERLSLPPTALVHLPPGPDAKAGVAPDQNLIQVEGDGIELGALKPGENGKDLILRLVERNGRKSRGRLTILGLLDHFPVLLHPYEIVTLRVTRRGNVSHCNLLEEPLSSRPTHAR